MRLLEFKLNRYASYKYSEIKDRLFELGGGDDIYGLNFYNFLGSRLVTVLEIYPRDTSLNRANLLFCGTSKLWRPKESVSDLGSLSDLRIEIEREMVKSGGEVLNRLKKHPLAAGAKGFDPYWRIMKGLYEQFIEIRNVDYMTIRFGIISVDERRSVSSVVDLGFLPLFFLL
jgi:hypothetical protein